MSFSKKFVLTMAVCATAATTAFAASHSGSAVDPEAALKARKAHMQLYAHNLGILGGMARGNIEFEAALAQTAADNLASLAVMSQDTYWVPGTAAGEIEGSKALPAIWEDEAGFDEDMAALEQAAMDLQDNAGSLDGVRGALRAVGGACGACHEDYRQSDD